METSMHGSFDKSGKPGDDIHGLWNIGFFAVPALVVIALVGLAIIQPAASNWISDAVQAEFAGISLAPEATPVQLAQPAMAIQTVKADLR
jgi:hypothetical protein